MNFLMPTRIVFGSGVLASLKDMVYNDLKSKKPFLVTDQGLARGRMPEKILSGLKGAGMFDGVEPNPRSTTVNKAGELIRRETPDLIIALGGGSAMDAAKAVALLATNPGCIEDYEGKGKYKRSPLPLLAIPTTCGTGSEVTWVSVINDPARRFKMSIKGPDMFPRVALVDPDLLMSLPKPVVAATGCDALTHAIEAYTVKPASPMTDLFAGRAIRNITGSIETAVQDIVNETGARENLMLGSTLAGIAFGNSDVGAVHCISESIGALFDVPHGVANAVFLPHVMKFNLPACIGRYAEIADMMNIGEGDQDTAAERLVQWIKDLNRRLGIPKFNELGIPESEFPRIAEYSFQNNSNPSNPRKVSVKDYVCILEGALAD